MTMNKVKVGSQMYPFLNDNGNKGYTWNPIRGKCPHACSYCYMKRWDRVLGPLRLEKKALADSLGSGRTIFVGSSTDMWAHAVSAGWIRQVLRKCCEHDNTYIFQSKNPDHFSHLLPYLAGDIDFPPKTILGTTLESNRDYDRSGDVPGIWARIAGLTNKRLDRFEKMVSIEPIMAFDFDEFLGAIKQIKSEFVSIGADRKGHNLMEPTAYELKELIAALSPITEIKLKGNLDRLLERE